MEIERGRQRERVQTYVFVCADKGHESADVTCLAIKYEQNGWVASPVPRHITVRLGCYIKWHQFLLQSKKVEQTDEMQA
jgi:hypothetical protein